MNVTQPQHSHMPEHNCIRESSGATRGHLVALPQEVPHALIDVVIDRSIRHQPRAITEIVRPSRPSSQLFVRA
jgi:hypothetical protein